MTLALRAVSRHDVLVSDKPTNRPASRSHRSVKYAWLLALVALLAVLVTAPTGWLPRLANNRLRACLQARGFGPDDFARSHPGGALGRRLLTRVVDIMRQGGALPTVHENATIFEALEEISRKGMGMTAVLDTQGRACGIFTDGDLRRLIERETARAGETLRYRSDRPHIIRNQSRKAARAIMVNILKAAVME